MKRKLYTALLVILPLFVGSGAATVLLVHFLGQEQGTVRNPFFMGVLAVAGMASGIAALWRLIEKAEG